MKFDPGNVHCSSFSPVSSKINAREERYAEAIKNLDISFGKNVKKAMLGKRSINMPNFK